MVIDVRYIACLIPAGVVTNMLNMNWIIPLNWSEVV